MKKVILVYGLPGSGKTTLAQALFDLFPKGEMIWFNADKVRSTISQDLGFTNEDRIEQARRMGCLASLALDGSNCKYALIDFVNPSTITWDAMRRSLERPKGQPSFDDSLSVPSSFSDVVSYPLYSVLMNTIKREDSRFEDTRRIFEFNGADLVVSEYQRTAKDFKSLAEKIYESVK